MINYIYITRHYRVCIIYEIDVKELEVLLQYSFHDNVRGKISVLYFDPLLCLGLEQVPGRRSIHRSDPNFGSRHIKILGTKNYNTNDFIEGGYIVLTKLCPCMRLLKSDF